MKNHEDRKYFFTLFGGKLLGLAVLFSAYFAGKGLFGGSNAWADESPGAPLQFHRRYRAYHAGYQVP